MSDTIPFTVNILYSTETFSKSLRFSVVQSAIASVRLRVRVRSSVAYSIRQAYRWFYTAIPCTVRSFHSISSVLLHRPNMVANADRHSPLYRSKRNGTIFSMLTTLCSIYTFPVKNTARYLSN